MRQKLSFRGKIFAPERIPRPTPVNERKRLYAAVPYLLESGVNVHLYPEARK